jgi:NADH pyrophosphatase NudC (nudix superfamily)
LDFAAGWRPLSEEIMAGIEEWRVQHLKATLQDIEAAVDVHLAELRVRMLEDVALASEATDVSQRSRSARPVCPHCGTVVEPRGSRQRQVTTHRAKTLRLTRSYVVCPTCQLGFFPPA